MVLTQLITPVLDGIFTEAIGMVFTQVITHVFDGIFTKAIDMLLTQVITLYLLEHLLKQLVWYSRK